LLSAGDERQLDFAHSTGRVLVTCDADFLRLHDRGIPHAGIVYSPKGKYGPGPWIHGLVVIAECLTPEEMMNHVEYL
jgi:hypothetical protein